jgi:hypothetical protein
MIRVVPQGRRRCWRPKVCYASIADAEKHAATLIRRDRLRGEFSPGCELVCYFCAQHTNFHLGHLTRKDLRS